MFNSIEVVMHDSEIIHTDVCELWTACNLADRPDTGRSGLAEAEPLTHIEALELDEIPNTCWSLAGWITPGSRRIKRRVGAGQLPSPG
jgi:hypothetical protein